MCSIKVLTGNFGEFKSIIKSYKANNYTILIFAFVTETDKTIEKRMCEMLFFWQKHEVRLITITSNSNFHI